MQVNYMYTHTYIYICIEINGNKVHHVTCVCTLLSLRYTQSVEKLKKKTYYFTTIWDFSQIFFSIEITCMIFEAYI